jgi:hypothetical protein
VIFYEKANAEGNCILLDRPYNGSSFAPSESAFVANMKGNSSNGTWVCDPAFEDAAKSFASLGVQAFVRHTHSSDEGTWWPSATGPKESWHPLVQRTNRSLPAEFLAKAKAAGIQVIFYHYMKTNKYYATHKPEWVQRWPNGTEIVWERGVGLSPCADDWVDKYISQVVELVNMGAEAFYFDEFPAQWGGDWNPTCAQKFQARYGEPMPTEFEVLEVKKGTYLPVAKDARVLQLMSDVTQAYFDKLSVAISSAAETAKASGGSGDAVALISIYRVPKADDGYCFPPRANCTTNGGGLYETTKLLHTEAAVAKTEMSLPILHSQQVLGGDPFNEDIFMSFGYALARDAASGRPPHIWIPRINTSTQALAASAALVTYGAIANPDHTEKRIPDYSLFNATYKLGAKVDAAFEYISGGRNGNGGRRSGGDSGDASGSSGVSMVKPIRYAAVLFSEKARNQHMPKDPVTAWQKVIFPTVGAWEALVREALPAAILLDWQVEEACGSSRSGGGGGSGGGSGGGVQAATIAPRAGCKQLVSSFPAIATPSQDALINATSDALDAYVSAGGTLVVLAPERQPGTALLWNQSADRSSLGTSMIKKIRAVAGDPTVEMSVKDRRGAAKGGGSNLGKLHLVAYASSHLSQGLLILLTNDFTWCAPGTRANPEPGPPPLPIAGGVSVVIRLPAEVTPTSASDVATGAVIAVSPAHDDDESAAAGGQAGKATKGPMKAWVLHVPQFDFFAGAVVRMH